MEYSKIIVKNNYEKRGDLVLRSYIRALKRAGKAGELLLNNDEAFIFGVIDLNGNFHEIFTNNIIDYKDYSKLTSDEYNSLCGVFVDLSDEEVELLQAIMKKVLFKEKMDLNFEVSTMEELSQDRAIEASAYDNYLSRINPWQRLNEENAHTHDDYNNFLRKIEEIKIMRKMDNINEKLEYDEYEVLENPRKLVKK